MFKIKSLLYKDLILNSSGFAGFLKMQQLNKMSILETVALRRFISSAEKRHTICDVCEANSLVFFSRAILAAENKPSARASFLRNSCAAPSIPNAVQWMPSMASTEREFAYRKLIAAWNNGHPCPFCNCTSLYILQRGYSPKKGVI